MRISHRFAILSLILVAATGSSCRRLRPGGGLKVKPAAEARALALGLVVAPNVDRTFERIGAIARELSLPFDVASMRTKALEEMKIPPEMAAGVETGAPISAVVLPPVAAGKSPQVVLAMSLKDAATGKKIMDGMGKPFARRDDAAGYKAKDGSDVWLWVQDRKLVVGDAIDALIAGAALAMESLHSSDDDMTVVLNPDAIAKSQGTDVKTAMAKWAQEMQNAPVGAGQTPAMHAIVQAVLTPMLSRITDTQEAQITLRVDAKRGAAISVKMRPRAGSAFASDAAQTAPYVMDPAVLAAGEPTMIGASAPMSFIGQMWREIAAQMIRVDPGAAEAVKSFDPIFTSITGAGSWATRTGGERWQQEGIYQLAPGVSPQAYLDSVVAATNSPFVPKLFAAVGVQGKPRITRDKDVLVGEVKLSYSGMPAQQAQNMKQMMGDKLEYALTAREGRIYAATGPGARARMTALMTPPSVPPAPTGELATALEETRGADAFMYMDLMQGMKAGMAGLGASPAVAALRLPMWFSLRGGQAMTYEWRIPMTAIRSAGALVPMIMMMFMGGGGGGIQ